MPEIIDEQSQPITQAPSNQVPQEQITEKASDILKPATSEPVELILANGVTVVLKKPSYPVNMLVARVLGKNSLNPMLTVYYKALCWVSAAKIPGATGFTAFKQLKTEADFERVSMLVGDDGLEEIVSKAFMPDEQGDLDKDDLKNE